MGDYDKYRIAVNQVIKYQGRYYAFYHGSGEEMTPRQWTTNVAVSPDRIHWKKYPGNPIVPGIVLVELLFPTSSGSDSIAQLAGSTIGQFEFDHPTKFRLYTMHSQVEAFMPASESLMGVNVRLLNCC